MKVAKTIYEATMSSRPAKYTSGRGVRPNPSAKGVKGRRVTILTPSREKRVTDKEARLFIKGSFFVRIM